MRPASTGSFEHHHTLYLNALQGPHPQALPPGVRGGGSPSGTISRQTARSEAGDASLPVDRVFLVFL